MSRHVPQRSCIVCGLKIDKVKLVRVVRSPAGGLALDPDGSMAGRGAYVCGADVCWDEALEAGVFARSLGIKGGALLKERLTEIRAQHEQLIGSTERRLNVND